VWEEVPPEKPQPESPDDPILHSVLSFEPSSIDNNFDSRQPTLELDVASVEVHEINAEEFTSFPHPVRRHRHTKGDTPL
jgi:hypothetical protein